MIRLFINRKQNFCKNILNFNGLKDENHLPNHKSKLCLQDFYQQFFRENE